MSLSTAQMMRALSGHLNTRQNDVFPNVFLPGGWEADLLCVHKSGYAEEFEVKVSKADFRAEFREKAHKHEWLVSGIPTAHWPIGPPTMASSYEVKNRLGQTIPIGPPFHPHLARRYWMAMPLDLARELLDDVPAHAGVLAVEEGGWMRTTVLRKAPALKLARKVTEEERATFLRGIYYRFWNLRGNADLRDQMFAGQAR